jgi:hypothetical protein
MALGDSFRLIESGRVDAMITGGVDYNLNYISQALMERYSYIFLPFTIYNTFPYRLGALPSVEA